MKTPQSRQASHGVSGKQLTFLDQPAFSPTPPKPSTHAARAFQMMWPPGAAITHLDFQKVTRSWRLAAYVKVLRDLGWPIETVEIRAPTKECAWRAVARYSMPEWVRDATEKL